MTQKITMNRRRALAGIAGLATVVVTPSVAGHEREPEPGRDPEELLNEIAEMMRLERGGEWAVYVSTTKNMLAITRIT